MSVEAGTKCKAEKCLLEEFFCKYCGDGILEEDNGEEECRHHPDEQPIFPDNSSCRRRTSANGALPRDLGVFD